MINHRPLGISCPNPTLLHINLQKSPSSLPPSSMRPALRLSHLSQHLPTYTHPKMPPSLPPAIIAGVGPGTGASVARRFASTYPVFLLARNPSNYESLVTEIQNSGGWAKGISTDISDAGSVEQAFAEIREFGGGRVSAAVFNVGGKFVRKPFLELGFGEWEAGWEAGGWVLFLLLLSVVPLYPLTPPAVAPSSSPAPSCPSSSPPHKQPTPQP